MGAVLCFLLFLAMAAAVAAVLIGVARKPLLELFRGNAHMAPGARFYARSFILVVVLGILAAVTGYHGPCPDQAESMGFWECLWRALDQLEPVLRAACLFLLGYVLLVTVLFAALGRYHVE